MKIGTTYSDSGTTVADNDLIVEGNLGIGKVEPDASLDVNGTVLINGSPPITRIGTGRYDKRGCGRWNDQINVGFTIVGAMAYAMGEGWTSDWRWRNATVSWNGEVLTIATVVSGDDQGCVMLRSGGGLLLGINSASQVCV